MGKSSEKPEELRAGMLAVFMAILAAALFFFSALFILMGIFI